MKLRYLGHACFLLTNDEGGRLLMDPFNEAVGYPVPSMPVDVVTVSHEHFDHNFIGGLPNAPAIVREPGTREWAGFKIEGHACFHDAEEGRLRGKNLVFVVSADGVRVAHLGDLGHIPTDGLTACLERVDVLLIPVGGYYTIDGAAAVEVTRKIRPRVAIPMHYATGVRETPMSTEEEYAAAMSAERPEVCEIDISKDALAHLPGAVVLKWSK